MHGIMTDIAYEQTCFAIQLFQNKNKEPKNLSKYRDVVSGIVMLRFIQM